MDSKITSYNVETSLLVTSLTNHADVRVITDPIEQFTEKGIQTTGNEEREFDLIICATGFDVAFAPHL